MGHYDCLDITTWSDNTRKFIYEPEELYFKITGESLFGTPMETIQEHTDIISRCSYCNVRALPNDRFCEGCGAPV